MRIAYVDLEVDEQTKKIGDIDVICGETRLHTAKVNEKCAIYSVFKDKKSLINNIYCVYSYRDGSLISVLIG